MAGVEYKLSWVVITPEGELVGREMEFDYTNMNEYPEIQAVLNEAVKRGVVEDIKFFRRVQAPWTEYTP